MTFFFGGRAEICVMKIMERGLAWNRRTWMASWGAYRSVRIIVSASVVKGDEFVVGQMEKKTLWVVRASVVL
jgi:hypothetical protein